MASASTSESKSFHCAFARETWHLSIPSVSTSRTSRIMGRCEANSPDRPNVMSEASGRLCINWCRTGVRVSSLNLGMYIGFTISSFDRHLLNPQENWMKVEIYSRQRVFDRFFKIDEATLRYERFDGNMSPQVTRLSFERGDSAAAVVFNTDTKRVILVNQFKYPSYEKGPGWMTEVVAGIVEPNESPETAIRREIFEEIGYEANSIEHISTFYVSPGGSSERIILYYAEVSNAGLRGPGGGLASESEDIKRIELTPEE